MTTSARVKRRTLFLLALLAAFPPLSTSMYLPSLPTLVRVWQSSEAAINLTLVSFFISFSTSLLVYGPLSDRFGRKPVLLSGIGLYVLACLTCSLADGPGVLIAGRILQGMGAASASTLSLAMTKDTFFGAERERVLAHVAVIVALAPMLAPVLGGMILNFAHWPVIFLVQAGMGLVAMCGVWKLKEPAGRSDRTLGQVMADYGRLMCHRPFIAPCVLLALGATPLFCFTGGSAFIFMTQYGLSEQAYSYFFALNSTAVMLGFWLCGPLLKRVRGFKIMMFGYAGALFHGILLVLCAERGLWTMVLLTALMTMCVGLARPPSNNFLLGRVDSGAGSAASLIMFSLFAAGAGSIWLIALPWANKVLILGLVGVCSSALNLIFLPQLNKSGA